MSRRFQTSLIRTFYILTNSVGLLVQIFFKVVIVTENRFLTFMDMNETATEIDILYLLFFSDFIVFLFCNICIDYNRGQNNWNKAKKSSKNFDNNCCLSFDFFLEKLTFREEDWALDSVFTQI